MTKNQFKKGDIVKFKCYIAKYKFGKIHTLHFYNDLALVSVPVGDGKNFYMGGLLVKKKDLKKASKSEIEKYHAILLAKRL